jgi:hypothetical protein
MLKKKHNDEYRLMFGTFEAVSLRRADEFLCIDPFAGRADEDELFRTHSKSCERAEMLHRVAAREGTR